MAFQDEMVALMPALRRFARSLTRRGADADDLLQDTVLRMWHARDRFEDGTNLRAWAFTILRNRFYNAYVPRYEFDDRALETIAAPPMQERHAEGYEIRRVLKDLDPKLRKVLAMTAEAGMDVEAVAKAIGCPVGTVKSRAFRARVELRRRLNENAARDRRHILLVEDAHDLALEMKAIIQSGSQSRVTTCSTAAEGLRICSQPGRIDVAILDMKIADEMLSPLIHLLQSRGARIFLASDRGKDQVPARFGRIPRFAKPISARKILEICTPAGL